MLLDFLEPFSVLLARLYPGALLCMAAEGCEGGDERDLGKEEAGNREVGAEQMRRPGLSSECGQGTGPEPPPPQGGLVAVLFGLGLVDLAWRPTQRSWGHIRRRCPQRPLLADRVAVSV